MARRTSKKTVTYDDSGNIRKTGGSMTREQYAAMKRGKKPGKAKK